jgi:type IV pilus assembly protein PilE
MIVVAILGILAAIAIPMYKDYITTARWSEAKTNLMSIRLLEEQYFSDNGVYIDGNYDGPGTGLDAVLPGLGFKPVADLHYDYSVAFNGGDTGTYTATATFKADTTKKFTITHDNVRLDQDNRGW